MSFIGTLKVEAKGDRELVMTREFNAGKDLVFDCFTKPELIKRWLYGPDGWSLDVCEVDLKVGGKYRYVWKYLKDGSTMGAGGTYKEISEPDKLIHTERFDEPWYPGEALLTTTFVETSGRTFVTINVLYETKEGRDIVIKSPMEGGAAQSYNRLETLLNTLTLEGKK